MESYLLELDTSIGGLGRGMAVFCRIQAVVLSTFAKDWHGFDAVSTVKVHFTLAFSLVTWLKMQASFRLLQSLGGHKTTIQNSLSKVSKAENQYFLVPETSDSIRQN